MTNTHITIGGHKVTAYKSGEVHNITFVTNVSSEIACTWQVVNRVCYVNLNKLRNNLTSATGMDLTADNAVPKAATYASGILGNNGGSDFQCNGQAYINAGATKLKYSGAGGGSASYGTLIYPVADDWVES